MRRTLSILALSMALFQGAQAAAPSETIATNKDGDKAVEIVFAGKANVTFPTVTANGATTLADLSGNLPAGFTVWATTPASYYNITTTATYTTPATICLFYNASLSEDAPQLIHKYGGEWADITLYAVENGVCGEVLNFSPFAVGTGFPYSMLLSSISSTNTDKRDNADSWSGKGVVNGFTNTEIKALDSAGFAIKLVDGNDKTQDKVKFTAAQCRLIMRSRGLSCKAPGVGSLSLKPFTSTTWTMAKSNKVNDVKTKSSSHSHHNSTKHNGPKGSTEDKVSYHKLAFKFYKRDFADDEFPTPLMVVVDEFPAFGTGLELVALNSDCKVKTMMSGTEKITCAPFDPEA